MPENDRISLGRQMTSRHESRAADVQLRQWIQEWCGLGGRDRNRSFDLLFRECRERFDKPMIVETGTIRSEEDWPGAGFFTYLAGRYVSIAGGVLHSVDNSESNCNFARKWCEPYGDAVKIHHGDSVEFLRQFGQPIDVLYCDSLDSDQPGHAEHGLAEVQAALPWLHGESLVVFDDSPTVDGKVTGKGALAVPWLVAAGWEVIHAGYQVVLSRGGHDDPKSNPG